MRCYEVSRLSNDSGAKHDKYDQTKRAMKEAVHCIDKRRQGIHKYGEARSKQNRIEC